MMSWSWPFYSVHRIGLAMARVRQSPLFCSLHFNHNSDYFTVTVLSLVLPLAKCQDLLSCALLAICTPVRNGTLTYGMVFQYF